MDNRLGCAFPEKAVELRSTGQTRASVPTWIRARASVPMWARVNWRNILTVRSVGARSWGAFEPSIHATLRDSDLSLFR